MGVDYVSFGMLRCPECADETEFVDDPLGDPTTCVCCVCGYEFGVKVDDCGEVDEGGKWKRTITPVLSDEELARARHRMQLELHGRAAHSETYYPKPPEP